MGIEKNITSQLLDYILNNEVVYQFCGELIEVSNNVEKENKETLLGCFRRNSRVEVYTKHDRWAKEGWPELANWSTDDDVLFLLQNIGVLICVPKKLALNHNLIAA